MPYSVRLWHPTWMNKMETVQRRARRTPGHIENRNYTNCKQSPIFWQKERVRRHGNSLQLSRKVLKNWCSNLACFFPIDGTQSNGPKIEQERFRWGIKGNFLIVRLVKYWRGCLGSLWSIYLKVFKNRLGEHCSGLTKFISSCCEAQAWHSSPL